MWISLPLPGLSFDSFLKIVFGNIYLPITARLEGACLIVGFSTTLLIVKFLLLTLFFIYDTTKYILSLIN